MTTREFRALLERLADGWRRRDYNEVVAAFAPGVSYADPLRYAFADRTALAAFFAADEGRPQRMAWHTILFDEAQQIGAGEYSYEGTHRYHGVALVRVDGGLITHWREYQHIDPRPWAEFIAGTGFPAGGENDAVS